MGTDNDGLNHSLRKGKGGTIWHQESGPHGPKRTKLWARPGRTFTSEVRPERSELRGLPTPAPRGFESTEEFAKRHGLSKLNVFRFMNRDYDPLPYWHDEQTGRYFINKEEGDKWVGEESRPMTPERQLRRTLARKIRALENLAEQFRLAGYETSHRKCLEMIEVFKTESGFDKLLPPKTGEDSQSD